MTKAEKAQTQTKPLFQGRAPLQPAGGVASLDAVMGGAGGGSRPDDNHDNEEDLFALPMSPRSPEMAKSPFSMLS